MTIGAIGDLVEACPPLGAADLDEVRLAFEDTLAVAFAGWNEPATRQARSLHPGEIDAFLAGASGHSADAEAFVLGTAGHALDYDDVQLASITHPSTVLVPALIALSRRHPGREARIAPAFAVGLAANVWLGRALCDGHYAAGWHATSTIGPLAAAAAGAHLLGLDRVAAAHALSLAGAQAGGMQVNFGTDAKPLQAGFAAGAGVRAVLLAAAGTTAAEDPFAARGFLDLYGGGAVDGLASPKVDLGVLSRKLFPCCYAAHRMVAAALDAHAALGGGPVAGDRVRVEVPAGLMTPLRVDDPRTGNEGKFCGRYTVAAALLQGRLGLGDFTDEAVARADVRALMDAVEIAETPAADGEGLDRGTVRLSVLRGNAVAAETEARHYPGAPQRPATADEMAAKVADCLAYHGRNGGGEIAPEHFRERVAGILRSREENEPEREWGT